MTFVGASHFKDRSAALRYYRYEGATAEDINTKLDEGLIHLGEPEVKPWESVVLNHEGRYLIKEPPMSHETVKAIKATEGQTND